MYVCSYIFCICMYLCMYVCNTMYYRGSTQYRLCLLCDPCHVYVAKIDNNNKINHTLFLYNAQSNALVIDVSIVAELYYLRVYHLMEKMSFE